MTNKLTLYLLVFLMLFSCSKQKSTKDYLGPVLNNLEKIESAIYFSTKEAFAPGDTIASVQMEHLINEYNNPLDTTIGAGYVSFLQKDTTQMTFCYDGKMRAVVYEEDKRIVIDSFNVTKLPFRPISPPFFNYTKSIIRYALETKDSISIDFKETNESVYCCLTIYEDQQVEFFGKPYFSEKNPYDFGDPISKYEIWIDKSTDLPYKYRREMSHSISIETVSNVNLNKLKITNFNASDYFMPDFEIAAKRSGVKPEKRSDMIGEVAHDWALQNVSDNKVALRDFKSNVVMIQFTSVTCGPCRASVPFLNRLKTAYKKDDFAFVAIECTSQSINALNSYRNRYSINYELLVATKSVLEEYKVKSFPVFFFLDKDLIIREIVNGYSIGATDAEIKKIIYKMTH